MMAASRTVGDGIPPAAIGEPGVSYGYPAGHLESRHGRDHLIVVPEFVDYHLIGRAASSESGREAIEDGKPERLPHWD